LKKNLLFNFFKIEQSFFEISNLSPLYSHILSLKHHIMEEQEEEEEEEEEE